MPEEAARILIVEDEPLVAMFASQVLEDLGFQICAISANGPEALAHAGRFRPRLALVDLSLNGPWDGAETARRLYKDYQVSCILASGRERDAQSALPFLAKPYTAVQLENLVAKVLGAAAPSAAAL